MIDRSSAPSRLTGKTPRPRAAKTLISALSSNSPTICGRMWCCSNQRSRLARSEAWRVGSNTGSVSST